MMKIHTNCTISCGFWATEKESRLVKSIDFVRLAVVNIHTQHTMSAHHIEMLPEYKMTSPSSSYEFLMKHHHSSFPFRLFIHSKISGYTVNNYCNIVLDILSICSVQFSCIEKWILNLYCGWFYFPHTSTMCNE